jgi:PAS domain S-box-containing protein
MPTPPRDSNISQHLLELFDAVEDVIYVRDMAGIVLDINAAGVRLFGRPKPEIVGHPFPEGDVGQIARAIAMTNRALLERGQARTRFEVQIPSGETRIFESTTTLFRDDAGQAQGAFGIMRDVSESIEAQESLRLANEKLMTLMAILQDEKDRTEAALVEARAAREEAERLTALTEETHAALEADHDRKTAEIDDARKLLLSLLPQQVPQRPDYEIAVYMKTASEVGGDYYDFVSGPGLFVAAVGDATGHGLRAGMLSAAAKSFFQELAPELAPGALLGRMNRAFHRMNLQTLYMAFAVVRIEDGLATIASAGLPPILVRQAASGYVRAIPAHGIPLGIYAASTYDEAVVELGPGDTMLIMSDGLADVFNADGEEYGYERILANFASNDFPSVDDLLLSFDRAAREWLGSEDFEDDITLVAVRRRE